MGLIYGHYDVRVNQQDTATEDKNEFEKVNTGIAIVTPIEKLIEMFEQENIQGA